MWTPDADDRDAIITDAVHHERTVGGERVCLQALEQLGFAATHRLGMRKMLFAWPRFWWLGACVAGMRRSPGSEDQWMMKASAILELVQLEAPCAKRRRSGTMRVAAVGDHLFLPVTRVLAYGRRWALALMLARPALCAQPSLLAMPANRFNRWRPLKPRAPMWRTACSAGALSKGLDRWICVLERVQAHIPGRGIVKTKAGSPSKPGAWSSKRERCKSTCIARHESHTEHQARKVRGCAENPVPGARTGQVARPFLKVGMLVLYHCFSLSPPQQQG